MSGLSRSGRDLADALAGSQANVRHTEDIIELILDSNRNSLLGLDLRVSIATLGLTAGALVAGLFGMVRLLALLVRNLYLLRLPH